MRLDVWGEEIHALTGGRPFDRSGPVAVLIHGSGMDATVWGLQSRYLAHHGMSVLAVDLPGHGRSGGAPLGNVEALGEWIVALLDAAGVERAALAGHSLGALVALACAHAAPERVRALALLGAAERMPVHPGLLAAAHDDVDDAIAMVVGWGFGRHAHLGGNPMPGLWMIGNALRLMERAGPGVLAADLGACDAFSAGGEMAAALRCPTTVMIGTADRMTPAKAGRHLASLVSDARIVELSGSGHMMMVEAPEPTARALLAAFGEQAGASTT
ncbi:MAG TPA: alpha/beta hydrolase [Arenibaculum sp.]|nr:alpha/beta hydrolase [Arenibaculum sp.]